MFRPAADATAIRARGLWVLGVSILSVNRPATEATHVTLAEREPRPTRTRSPLIVNGVRGTVVVASCPVEVPVALVAITR